MTKTRNAISAFALMLSMSILPAWADTSIEAQHMESAKSYMQNGQWAYAGYAWRAALQLNPDNLEAHLGLAETLMQSGYLQEAISHLEQMRQHIKKPQVEHAYARALERAGQTLEATRVYMQCMESNPQDGQAFQRLIAIKQKLPKAQQGSLDAFLSRKANEAAQKGREALQAKRYDEAAAHFGISTAYLPRVGDINDYGAALLLTGQYNSALAQYNTLNQSSVQLWKGYANMAFAALGQGKTTQAAVGMEKAIGLCEDNRQKPMLYNALGYIYESQRQWHKAISAYLHAMELDPKYTKAKLNLAYVYQKDRAYEKAIDLYQQILRADPDNVPVLNRLGFVYELAHKERQAAEVYQKATRISPNEKDGYFNLAVLYRKMGKTEAADAAYRKMMDIEFKQIEAGQSLDKTAARNKDDAMNRSLNRQDERARLLDYVDVFFSG